MHRQDKSLLLAAMTALYGCIASTRSNRGIDCSCFNHLKISDVYHAPRMQHVTSVLWSLDNKYVLSGSDEFNIRLWKAYASEKLGPVIPIDILKRIA